MSERSEHQDGKVDSEERLASTVRDNSRMLRQLLDQIADLNQLISTGAPSGDVRGQSLAGEEVQTSMHLAWDAERDQLNRQITELRSELEDLRQQNRELAGKVAGASLRKVTADQGETQSLSWEQRKKQMIQQLEQESFDAEALLAEIPDQVSKAGETPERFVKRLVAELESRDQEIKELRSLLEHQSETDLNAAAEAASAIAEVVDRDELVQQERERLKQLQVQWEEKFRKGEIEASLERAKLSRERQELARKQRELDEHLEQLRRELHPEQEGSSQAAPSSRRWLVKLGLCDHQ